MTFNETRMLCQNADKKEMQLSSWNFWYFRYAKNRISIFLKYWYLSKISIYRISLVVTQHHHANGLLLALLIIYHALYDLSIWLKGLFSLARGYYRQIFTFPLPDQPKPSPLLFTVLCQTILLINGDPLGGKGLTPGIVTKNWRFVIEICKFILMIKYEPTHPPWLAIHSALVSEMNLELNSTRYSNCSSVDSSSRASSRAK